MSRPLSRYREKRNFTATAEPRGSDAAVARRKKARELVFVVQKHAASHLHFDLRLEVDGVMKSWAVPKGPSYDPDIKRLAMEVEDHPMEYNSFEGTIPKGQYGGGTVMLWDRGTYTPEDQKPEEDASKAARRGLHAGKLSFTFHGDRLNGAFTLIRTRRSDNGERSQWILLKQRDETARPGSDIVAEVTTSVDSGRTMEQIAGTPDAIWHSNRDEEELKDVLEGFGGGAIEPMLPTDSSDGIEAGIWSIEPVMNGRRALAFAANGVAQLVPLDGGEPFVESGQVESIHRHLKTLARSREAPLVLDGFVKPHESGGSASYIATDALVEGDLLLEEPYIERRLRMEDALAKVVASAKGALQVPPLLLVTRDDIDDAAEALNTTAVVAKRIDSLYQSGESENWRRLDLAAATHNTLMTIPAGVADATVNDEEREVALTNLQKPFWPELGITKGELLQYYASVAPFLLPHLVDRAMVMKRYPHGASGEFFFMKRAPEPRPEWIETCAITHASKSVINFPMVQNLASLLWVINLGCIDLNPWYSRCDDVDRPDFLHFDLDPVPDADFGKVRETALQLRMLLDELNLPSFPKTSGSKGIHVYIPIIRGPLQKQVWTIAKAIAREMESRHPELVTAEYRIAKRPKGRVLVDYNQNAWGRTLASVYSVRPRPTASVSVPVTWEEIEQGVEIEAFTLRTVPDRLAQLGDLWAPLLEPEGRVQLENIL